MDRLALVVMERGSPWPPEIHRDAVNLVALAQEPHESGAALLQRVRAHVQAIEQTGRSVRLAVLCCNDEIGSDVVAARVLVAWVLLEALRRTERGRLLLLARPSSPGPLRSSLLELAGALTGGLAGSSTCVTASLNVAKPGTSRPERETSARSVHRTIRHA